MLSKDAMESSPGTHYKDFAGQTIHNHLNKFEMSAFEGFSWDIVNPLTIQEHLPAIYRCFSASSLAEIIDRLMYEKDFGNKEWAESTLKNLSEKSPLSLELTFFTIRKAYNSE